jgi:preprotein translocase subunit SecA
VFSAAGTDNRYALEQITGWANSKFNLDWKPERFENRAIEDIARELVEATKQFTEGGRLEREVDDALARYAPSANGELRDWATNRFGRALDEQALEEAVNGGQGDARDVLVEAGQQLARWELTQLERSVLLRIYDQAWKDHLLEMDHLKHAIMQRPLGGDQTHPQSRYAIEGREQFDLMWKFIRERVTDIIFKVSAGVTGETASTGGLLARAQAQHQSSVGAGFANADQEAAMRAQGQAAKPQTIRRDVPKVGRNDPCPCGSGKKYKQCCGKKA